MRVRPLLLLCLGMLFAACTAVHESHVPEPPDGGHADAGGMCLGLGDACGDPAMPCCEGHCSFVEYAVRRCVGVRPIGAWCVQNEDCANGSCTEGYCGGPPACIAEGASCEGGLCCAGLACVSAPHGPVCFALRADGAACSEGWECATGTCPSGVCGGPSPTPECAPAGTPCFFATEGCCPGLRCRGLPTSYVGTCALPGSPGESCDTNEDCVSGTCDAGACR